jgi:small subunit ribosomal protein S6
MIDAELPEERRAQIIADVKRQIESSEGGLKADSDWGTRKMAYEIKHHPEAHYHLFQLEATPDLLAQLDHALKIEDAVLRHRIIEGAAPIQDKPPPTSSRPAPGRQAAPEAGESREAGDTSGAGESMESGKSREAGDPTEAGRAEPEPPAAASADATDEANTPEAPATESRPTE